MDAKMKNIWRKGVKSSLLALFTVILSLSVTVTGKAYGGTGQTIGAEAAAGTEMPGQPEIPLSFDVQRFMLPEEARVLVVVEGIGGSECRVYVYERPDGEDDIWEQRFCVPGRLGKNGMSNNRVMGDKTTPIGVFEMDTPFGQGDPLDGFPENYVKVTADYVWADETNRLEPYWAGEGERVGTKKYKGFYEYVLNAGYNKNAIEKKGTALFLHCDIGKKEGSAGCVRIPREQMIEVMRLYGVYGDGACYIAQAPWGTFSFIYDTFGANCGLSPEGDFTSPQFPVISKEKGKE